MRPARSLHGRLREATGACHAVLEHALGLLRPSCGAAHFRALLGRFHGFHRAWEPALANALGDDDFLRRRQREPLLRADLRALGLPAADIDALPACAAAAALCRTPAAALGSLYVLEGSTLGGQQISRHLAQASWAPPGGLRYFDPHRAATGQRWRETLTRLEATPGAWHPALIDGAVATFGLLHGWLPHAGRPAPTEALGQHVAETIS